MRGKMRSEGALMQQVGWPTRVRGIEEELLAEAEVRLYQAKFEAVTGMRYDPDEYDQIVLRYRMAKQRADHARATRQQASSIGQTAVIRRATAVPTCEYDVASLAAPYDLAA